MKTAASTNPSHPRLALASRVRPRRPGPVVLRQLVGLGLGLGMMCRAALGAEPVPPADRTVAPGQTLPFRLSAAGLGKTNAGSNLTARAETTNAPTTNAGAATTLPARNMGSLDDKQKLGVGDKVTFRVLEDREDPKSLTITDAGELDVPELGLITAAGKTCRQLAFEIKGKLEQTTYYTATVILGVDVLNKTMSGRKVYVVGQVRLTGPQEIPAGETWTVSKAIMKAGGFTDFADKKKVRLVRGGGEGATGKTFVVNVGEIWERGRTENDLSVEPEDLIYVATRAINFY